jgi:hypothetical protein
MASHFLQPTDLKHREISKQDDSHVADENGREEDNDRFLSCRINDRKETPHDVLFIHGHL